MSWKVEVKPSAVKQYSKLDAATKSRIKEALRRLETQENPLLDQQVRPLTGELKGDYRLRVGKWRVLFTPNKYEKILYVYAIIPRGEAY